MSEGLEIGGAPVVRLEAQDAPSAGPAFLSAEVLPGRGMMLLQARLRLASGEVVDALHAPPPAQAAAQLSGGPEDFNGNASFKFGGALLAPYANRITGRSRPEAREIEAVVDGAHVRLPRNWGGQRPGAQQYAMHGLILDARAPWRQGAPDRVTGTLDAGDFGGHWPSRTRMTFEWRLAAAGLELTVEATNVGDAPLPFGLGWHPYFALPSGQRSQARLRLPAAARTEVDDYDQVLPTGRILPVEGSAYDFAGPDGRALGDLYLDDCFTQLKREHGQAVVEILDPAGGVGLRIASASPQVQAIQVYAPPEQAFVVVEPQFNLADPYSALWGAGVDTGMARLSPGEGVTYSVRVQPFALGNPIQA